MNPLSAFPGPTSLAYTQTPSYFPYFRSLRRGLWEPQEYQDLLLRSFVNNSILTTLFGVRQLVAHKMNRGRRADKRAAVACNVICCRNFM